MQQTTTFARVLSTVAGLGLFGVVGYVNVRHTSDFDMQLVVGSLAAAAAVAAFVMQTAWRAKQRGLAVLALVGVLAGEGFGFVTTAERLLSARDQRLAHRVQANDPRLQAKQALDDALKQRDIECATGRGPRCLALEQTIATRREAYAKSPALVTENHLASATGWSALLIDLVPTLAGSTALVLLGFVFLWFGHGPGGGKRQEVSQADTAQTSFPVPEASRQDRALTYIREYTEKHGRPPSFTVVRNELNLPKATAHRYLKRATG